MRVVPIVLAILLLLPQAAAAIITFTQLDDDVFTVSHRVKLIGSRAKATRLVYTKAASLCIAAGFSHYRVLSEQSEAAQEDDSANATLRVKYFRSNADDRTGCRRGSDPVYIEEARQELARMGYRPPPPEAGGEEPAATAADCTPTGTCSLEQIAAMARAGLTDEQIRGACE